MSATPDDPPHRWGKHFLNRLDNILTYGNNPNTRIIVVSMQAKTDKDYVENHLENHTETNRVSFHVLDILDDNLCDLLMERFLIRTSLMRKCLKANHLPS